MRANVLVAVAAGNDGLAGIPQETFHAPEILAHCQRIGKKYGLYDNALFHTQAVSLDWDEARLRWLVRTTRGDAFTAQFIGMGTGPLHAAGARLRRIWA